MASIPKIALTPIKWASKQFVNRALLRFPGGDSHDAVACVYCPEMCRFSCPTAVVSGNDAVTPCNKMGLLHREKKWPARVAEGGELWPIYDCTGCGRCTEFCVYGMPVMEKLFEARQKFGWEEARQAAAKLTDDEDCAGDLAHELGDAQNGLRRAQLYAGKFASAHCEVKEPKALHFLKSVQVEARLDWERQLLEPVTESVRATLSGKRWLVQESPWLNRHLGFLEVFHHWVKRAQDSGVQLVLPFMNGKDCIDCGGEGAFPLLFPGQAAQMAREFWERDRDRVDAILTVSERSARHIRATLGKDVRVKSLVELLG